MPVALFGNHPAFYVAAGILEAMARLQPFKDNLGYFSKSKG
jgi:hypothetical protein